MASAPAELLIDLSHVDFIDSTGLGAVVDVAHRCSGRVAVIAPRGSAAAVLLQLTGLGQVLDVFESRQTAVAD
jgi:anti-anti-sigma factor